MKTPFTLVTPRRKSIPVCRYNPDVLARFLR